MARRELHRDDARGRFRARDRRRSLRLAGPRVPAPEIASVRAPDRRREPGVARGHLPRAGRAAVGPRGAEAIVSSGIARARVDWVHVPAGGPPLAPEVVGGKGHHLERLAALERAGAAFTVPRFVVVPAAAFVEVEIAGRAWPADETDARARAAEVRALPLPSELESAIAASPASTGLERAVLAVRSSAAAEDSRTRSFAGQFDTVLGVRAWERESWSQAVRQVWASAFHAWAAAYAGSGGAPAPVRMAVVIQELVDPRASGVAFSADPVSGARDVAVV
ncbi:MAG: hypothetical protein E6K80_00460, partial [Candidatus Eisenbacteria bacterium]